MDTTATDGLLTSTPAPFSGSTCLILDTFTSGSYVTQNITGLSIGGSAFVMESYMNAYTGDFPGGGGGVLTLEGDNCTATLRVFKNNPSNYRVEFQVTTLSPISPIIDETLSGTGFTFTAGWHKIAAVYDGTTLYLKRNDVTLDSVVVAIPEFGHISGSIISAVAITGVAIDNAKITKTI